MSNRSEYDLSDLIDYEYFDSDLSVHTHLCGLSNLDGQSPVALAQPLDAHQYFEPQGHDNGTPFWERSHQARGECSMLPLYTSFSTDFGMDIWDEARTSAFSRVREEVSQEQQAFRHPSFDPNNQIGEESLLSPTLHPDMASSYATHVQLSHINLPCSSSGLLTSSISNDPGHQKHDCGSCIKVPRLPVMHTPVHIDLTKLAEPLPMLHEMEGELRSTCINSLPSTIKTDPAFAGPQSTSAGLSQTSEAVASILPAQGSSSGPRSTLATLTPSHPKPRSNATLRNTNLASRLKDRNRVEKKPPQESKSRNRTSLTPSSSGPKSKVKPKVKPKVQPSVKPVVPSDRKGVEDATNTLLLASKSNYENILDGTIVPGGLYPASFSTALASKRTSHKTAEQERRERLNKALGHLQAILPSSLDEVIEIETSDSCAAQASNCKAGRIEIAVKCIRRLQRQVSEKSLLLQARNQEIERLKRDLAAEQRSSRKDAAEDAVV